MEKLTKKEKRELRKLKWQEELKKQQQTQKLKKIGLWTTVTIVILAAIGFILLLANTSDTSSVTLMKVKPISSFDIIKGNKNAKVSLIEYSDFQCPACAAYHSLVNQLLINYKDEIYFAYRFFPISSIHKNAMSSAQASYAAYKQGKFFEMSDLLFNNQATWQDLDNPTTTFEDYATSLKLDLQKFRTDLNSGETKDFIQSELDEGLNAGITYTPSFILNGKLIQNPNSYEAFKKLIDDEIKK